MLEDGESHAHPLAYGLAVALDLFILFIGGHFLVVPRAAAAAYYGVPGQEGQRPRLPDDQRSARRDYGLVGLALLAFANAPAEAWFMLVVARVPLGDAVIVLRNGGTKAIAFGIHFATAVVVLLDAALLFAV